jgi:hypothetical protein
MENNISEEEIQKAFAEEEKRLVLEYFGELGLI